MLGFLEDEWTMHAKTKNYSLYYLKTKASSDAFTHTHTHTHKGPSLLKKIIQMKTSLNRKTTSVDIHKDVTSQMVILASI